MKRWWHYLLLGTFAWLLFLVWRLPAGVAYELASASRELPVKLAGLHDTLWDGGAQQLQYRGKYLGDTSWKLSPWWLLLGKVDATVNLLNNDSYLEAQLEVPLAGGELLLSQVKGSLALPLLQQHLSLVPLPLLGELSLKFEELVVDESGRLQRAEGRMVWYRAGVQLAERLQLGDLQMTLQSTGEGAIEGAIRDSGGPLQLQATLTLAPDGSYQLAGEAKPGESAEKALRDALAMLGKPDSQGSYPLNFSGHL